MKPIAFALLMLVASAAAFSQDSTADLSDQKWDLADIILSAIDRLKQRIQDRGLDPYDISRAEVDYVLISPSILAVSAYIDNFRFSGLSNIDVVDIGYSLISNKLHFYVRLPEVSATVGSSGAEVSTLGREVNAKLSGRLAIKGLGIAGEARITRALDNSKISVSDVTVSAKLSSIESNININVLGLNLSGFVNNWLNNLPENLTIYEDLINSALARIITIVINRLW